jgi:dihydrofolate reductase
MIVSAVVVTDLNNAMGKDNKLLCHLPADLKFFKSVTMGHPIIMGRKTYDSIGRLLPGRRNIIISRNKDLKIEGAEIFSSFEEALKTIKDEKVSVIGGAEIYKLSWPYLTEIYRTLIKHEFEEADTYFPDIKFADWELNWEEEHMADDKNPYDYIFQKYVRLK